MQFADVNSGTRPSPVPPIPFFKSPPAKNQNGEERHGEWAGRAVLRAWRGSGRSGRTFRVKATTHTERASQSALVLK